LASVFRSFAYDPDAALRQALPAALVERLAAAEGVTFGEQANAVYTPPVTLWAFLTQALSGSKSCVAAVARVMVLSVPLGRTPGAAGTAAYCKARAKPRPPTRRKSRRVTPSQKDLPADSSRARTILESPSGCVDAVRAFCNSQGRVMRTTELV
jgi:hypothetical protein